MRRCTIAVALLGVLAAVGTAKAGGSFWSVRQLTDNSCNDTQPQIYGSNVVWAGGEGNAQEIFLYNGTTTTQLTDNTYADNQPQVYGSNVVWVRFDDADPEIFLYDGNTTTQLTDNSYTDDQPHIYGSNVVWYGRDNNAQEIFFYNGTTTTQLTNNNSEDYGPRIHSSNVVWISYDGSSQEIFLYDGTTTSQLTNFGPAGPNLSAPQIFGSNVVWVGGPEIFLYDGTTTSQLTNFGAGVIGGSKPQVYGSNVVWQGYDGSDWEIFLYDGNSTTQLTNNTYNDGDPQIYGSNIVWFGYDGSDEEFFFYDGTSTTQLTNNTYTDLGASLYESDVVWYGWDGNDYEIFQAVLISDLEPRQWRLAGGGSYNGSSNWAGNIVPSGVPNGVDFIADFLGTITSDSTVTVDSPVTLGRIDFDNANSYTLAGPAEITLETSGGDARINVLNGSHTISSPVSLAGDLTVDTAAETRLRFTHGSPRFVIGGLTKEGLGESVLDGGIMPLGEINVESGTLQVRKDLLAMPGGEVNIAAGATLKIGGSVNRRVLGVPGAVLEATANGTAIGLFSATDGYNFQGQLEVGPYMVGLMDADNAQVYETHLGGGSLSSFNGIGLQAVDVFGTLGTHQGWLTGHGTVKGAVRFEVDGANFAAIAGDGPGQELVLDGVVSGSGYLEHVIMTGLHRPGASAGFTGLGQGTNIGPGATVMGIDGTAGFATPNPAENAARGYDQWFAMFGQHAISGDLTIALEAPTPGGEWHVPDPSVRYEIFKSYGPGGNANAGWYIGWFNNVTLDPSWPNPTEWVWEFDYLRGGLGHGTAPDPGRAFYSATLMVVPEPGTLVMLAMGAAALLACGWQGRRRKVPR